MKSSSSSSNNNRPRSAARMKRKKKSVKKDEKIEDEITSIGNEDREGNETESYLLQRQERFEKNVEMLFSALEVLGKEEESMAEANECILSKVENLKRLNSALANSAEQQRIKDTNSMMKQQNAIETQLMVSQQKLQQKDEELNRLRRKLEESETLSNRQRTELSSLRGIVQELQRSEKSLQEDLNTAKRRATNAEKRAEELHNQSVAMRLEKDSVTQRFLQLTRSLSAVAQGHSIMNTAPSSSPEKNSPKRMRKDNCVAAKWTVKEVGDWLRTHGFEKYVTNFAKNSVDGDMLFDLTDSDLSGVLVMKDSSKREAFLLMRDALL